MPVNSRNISPYMSKKIGHMMFIMSVFVIFGHMVSISYLEGPEFHTEQYFEFLISQIMDRAAIPLFFCFSGYLTFSKLDINSKSLLESLKTKFRTLIIPYLLWNCFYTCFNIFNMYLHNSLNEIVSWPRFILGSLVFYESNFTFWYLFQLIILYIISPLLYILLKRKERAVAALLVFGLMYVFICDNSKAFLQPGIFFYSLGAVSAMYFRKNIDCSFWNNKTKKLVSGISLVIYLMITIVWILRAEFNAEAIQSFRQSPVGHIYEALIALSFWFIMDLFPMGNHDIRWFEKQSFFIYASHLFVKKVTDTVIYHFNPISTAALRLAFYLLEPALMIIIILAAAKFLSRFMPSFYGLISGGRGRSKAKISA